MGHNVSQDMDGRVNVRVPSWVEDRIDSIAEQSGWANPSQVARDMLEMGIIHYEMVNTEGVGWDETSVKGWERPKGDFAGSDKFVCPNCVHSNKYLFRLRKYPGPNQDVVAIECLSCSYFSEPENFTAGVPEDYYWARSGPHAECHIVDPDERRTLCGTYNTVGLDTFGTPDTYGRPKYICEGCWHELIGWEED